MQNNRSQVRLFFGAAFISAENSDIYFEVKAVLCFIFYAFRDVFRRNGIVRKIALPTTVLSLRELFRKIKTPSRISSSEIDAPALLNIRGMHPGEKFWFFNCIFTQMVLYYTTLFVFHLTLSES